MRRLSASSESLLVAPPLPRLCPRCPSDYNSVFLPSGPGWSAEDVFKLLIFRRVLEQAKSFSYYRRYMWQRNNPGVEDPYKDGPRPRTYVYDFLTSKTADRVFGPYCTRLRQRPLGTELKFVLDASGCEGRLGLPATLEWITVDPGRQYVSGSFHPVSQAESNWFEQAYRKGVVLEGQGGDEGEAEAERGEAIAADPAAAPPTPAQKTTAA